MLLLILLDKSQYADFEFVFLVTLYHVFHDKTHLFKFTYLEK